MGVGIRELKELGNHLRFVIRDNTINRGVRDRVKVERISIISSDCIGGVLYKDLHRRMDSPTINMFFAASDFVKFCNNLDYYLDQSIVCDQKLNGSEAWPVGKLGDITVHLVHYRTVEEASAKWEERKKRVHRDSLYFMMNDRNGCTEKEIAAFDALPYAKKVIFTHKPYPMYKSAYCISGSEQDGFVKVMTAYVGRLSITRRYDEFDVAAWINQGLIQKRL